MPYAVTGAWTSLTLVNSWAAVAGYDTPAVRLQGDTVRLRGAISGGTSGTTVATLTTAFRPATQKFLLCIAGTFNTGLAFVSTAGLLQVTSLVGNVNTFCELDGLTFSL